MPASCVLVTPVLAQAKSCYLRALRDVAHVIKPLSGAAHAPSNRAKNCDKRKRNKSETVCFFSPAGDEEDQEDPDPTVDSVVDEEVQYWEDLSDALIKRHTCAETSLLNEFAMVSEVKTKAPLHYCLFRQVSSHLAHEGDTEQLFSISKGLADPNTHPSFLRILTKISSNKKIYKPSHTRIWDRYQAKFKGARCFDGKESSNDDSDTDSGSSSDSD